VRSAINPLFTPKRMAALDDKVRAYARTTIAAFRDRGDCELMHEFAFEFPIRVFIEPMGLPLEDMKQLLDWERGLLHRGDLATVVATTQAVTTYLRDQIDRRRIQVRLIDPGFTDDGMMGFCFYLFVGELDTVSTNIGHPFRHLAERPAHKTLRHEPSRIADAIEEFMRAFGASVTLRNCVRQVKIGGVMMMPG
jgi:cytochrome P450